MFDYNSISQAIIDGEAEKVLELTEKAIAEGYPAEKILEKGLVQGMEQIAEKFRHDRVLVPEVLLSTRAMHAGLDTVQPYLKKTQKKIRGKIVIGTVEGDLHDIGKNLVSVLLRTMGLEVIDLDVNVSVRQFVQAVRREKPHILMMSALLTTTMPAMKRVIDELKDTGLSKNIKIVVGGAPITPAFAEEIGADYYFSNVFEMRKFFEVNVNKIIVHK